MKQRKLLGLLLGCCLFVPAIIPVVFADQPRTGSQEITVSFIGRKTISQRFMLTEETMQALKSVLQSIEAQLAQARHPGQAASIVTHAVIELAALHLLPSAITPLEVIRQVTGAGSSSMVNQKIKSLIYTTPLNVLCFIYAVVSDELEDNVWDLVASFFYALWFLTHARIFNLLTGFFSWYAYLRHLELWHFMNNVNMNFGWTETYFTYGLKGVVKSGQKQLWFIGGFSGLKITFLDVGSVYLGFALYVQ